MYSENKTPPQSTIKLIILDRDGVINEDSDNYIKSPEEWIPIPGSIEAISILHQAGYLVAIATNQSGIARGYYDLPTLEAMHKKMTTLLQEQNGKIDAIEFCPHGPDDQCVCRKPLPGMLQKHLQTFQVRSQEALFIGDTYSDYLSAKNANISFCLVKTGKGVRTLHKHPIEQHNVPIYENLKEFVTQFLADQSMAYPS